MAESNYQLELTDKQWEFISEGYHKFNFKEGATRAGKTWLDFIYVIPSRLAERENEIGLNFIFGVSKSTIERNILSPMRNKWGKNLVGEISSDNTTTIFGQKVYCIGDYKANQTSVIRGSDIKYAYMDEATECNEEVFMLILSRLDRECSIMDATYNPKSPNHFLKRYIDKSIKQGLDIWVQRYTIWDNPTLPKSFVDSLCKQYEGTVFYGRYILGLWTAAEGVIFRKFAENPENFILDEIPKDIMMCECGIDFGGNKSAHTFVLTGFQYNFSGVVILESEELRDKNTGEPLRIDGNELADAFVKFMKDCEKKYPNMGIIYTNYDSAEPVLARTLEQACMKNGIGTQLRPAAKTSIMGRINLKTRLIGSGRYHVMRWCNYTINATAECVWDSKKADIRVDDGITNDVDIQDAEEYSWERYMNELLDYEYLLS